MNKTYQYTIGFLQMHAIRYEIHNLPSEVKMVDIWHDSNFYVLQFENGFIGFSEISLENPGFDTIPDEKYYDPEMFKKKLEAIFTFT